MACRVVPPSKSSGGRRQSSLTTQMETMVYYRRGEDLQEELWSKYSSGEPSTTEATYGVAEVIVYDLQQILKKYGLHRGRYVVRFPSTIDELDFYRGLEEEKNLLLKTKDPRWTSSHRNVTLKRRRRV